MNYPRFFEAYRCNKWLHITENFGHVDMMDPAVVLGIGLIDFCSMADQGTIGFISYRNYVGGAIAAVMRAAAWGEEEMYMFIEQRDLIPRADMIGVKIQFDTSCSGGVPRPGCFD